MNRREFLAACALAALPPGSVRAGWGGANLSLDLPSSFTAVGSRKSTPRIVLAACGGAGYDLCQGLGPVMVGATRKFLLDSRTRGRTSAWQGASMLQFDDIGAPRTPAVARLATHSLAAQINPIFAHAELLVIVAGLGGGAGTGGALALHDLAVAQGIPSVLVGILPAEFEGSRRHEITEQALAELQGAGCHVLCIGVDDALKAARGDDTSFDEMLSKMQEAFNHAVWHCAGRWQPGSTAGVELGDFVRLLGRAGAIRGCGLGWGEGDGPARATQAVGLALSHPMLGDLGKIAGLSVSLRSGMEGLSPAEVRSVLKQIRERVGSDVEILFDTIVAQEAGDSLEVSVWAVRTV